MTIARTLRGVVLRMRIQHDNSKDTESSSIKNCETGDVQQRVISILMYSNTNVYQY